MNENFRSQEKKLALLKGGTIAGMALYMYSKSR